MSLFWRIFLLNAAMLTIATILLLGPVTVSTPVLLTEALVLGAGLVIMLIANAVLLRIGLGPLRQLTGAMTRIDLLRPGLRLEVKGDATIAELMRTFNTMLERLEAERAASNARALSAQEAERRRIAAELHDEVGQTLTAVLLELRRVADQAPEPMREDLHKVQEITRESLDEIRRIARRLRPGVLEELGLVSALKELAAENSQPAGLVVRTKFDPDLPELSQDAELVIYRVAQESVTNVVRHARARHLEIEVSRTATGVRLVVRDDGIGLAEVREGAGIRGMRERALLVGAELSIRGHPGRGTEVQLDLPTSHGGG